MADVQFRVENVAFVTRSLQAADAQLKREGQTELRALGELVEHDAEVLARATIRNMTQPWAQMRTGVAPRVVYVVPQQKGTRGRGPKHRPNFAPLMKRRAMTPALQRKRPEVIRRYNSLVGRICKAFNRG